MPSSKQTEQIKTPSRRGRPRKSTITPEVEDKQETAKRKSIAKTTDSTPSKQAAKKTPAKKTSAKKKKVEIETEESEYQGESSSESEHDTSDEEFKPETEKSETEASTELESEDNNVLEESDFDASPTKSRTSRLRSHKFELPEHAEENAPLYDVFNKDEKITEWEYEVDQETRTYQKPKIPNLTDDAILPFISTKSKPPKVIIYECPYCVRVFTYTLVFKSHLYSCEQNKNIPEYVLFCVKCDFKAKKKQDMVNHYTESHLKESNLDQDEESNSKFELTTCKKNQLNAANYLFIDNLVLKFTQDYNRFLFEMNRSLFKIDRFLSESIWKEIKVKFNMDTKYLKFEYNNSDFILKGFEFFSLQNDRHSFKLINFVDQITAFDWCPLNNLVENYLAVCTLPNEELISKIMGSEAKSNFKTLLDLDKSANLIYIYKFSNLNSDETPKKFAILNTKIGHISQLKWRPDYGKSNSLDSKNIGYLLTCGSDGNAYVYQVKDQSDNDNDDKNLIVYEPNKLCVLKPNFSFGQCTTGDWSHLNGAYQIALGYSNGTVGIYHLNSSYLNNQLLNNSELIIRPVNVINAHFTFVKTIKWSRLNSDLICTGSVFSREIKVWNLNKTEKALIEYEIFSTDFEFSLHSNDLYMSKEINLKGENHMIALTLEFNLFNSDKDESRAHSSLFYTNSTMNSINNCDYFNKFLLCDNDGSVILSRSDNSKYWVQKNKLMCQTYSVYRLIQSLFSL